MIRTTRSRVCFFMNTFRNLDSIDYNKGGLDVHSSLLNIVLHDYVCPQLRVIDFEPSEPEAVCRMNS